MPLTDFQQQLLALLALLAEWARSDLPRQFQGRVLDVDTAIAAECGSLTARARKTGRPLPVVEGLLLTTALLRDLTVATRNVDDFAGWGPRC